MYRLARFFIFLFPAEFAHDLGIRIVSIIGFFYRVSRIRRKQRPLFSSPFGLLSTPVGLAAGLDKNAKALWGWEALGFSFVEVGTITPMPQAGNPKPRVFRLESESAIINRMGFNNEGVDALAKRVRIAKDQGLGIPVGINIGKNKNTPLEKADEDYGLCAKALSGVADYLVINVSSPNTPGLRELQTEESLSKIIRAVRKYSGHIPVFIKIAPDHFTGFQNGILKIAKEFQLAGIVCGNTLAGHGQATQGGLSGKPLFSKNCNMAKSYAQKEKGLFLIGVGGIFCQAEARSYFEAGCSLIQIYTGLVYRGPHLVRELNAAFQSSRQN